MAIGIIILIKGFRAFLEPRLLLGRAIASSSHCRPSIDARGILTFRLLVHTYGTEKDSVVLQLPF